jgi:hypothetical protein
VACPCGVAFERWVTPEAAEPDLLCAASLNSSLRISGHQRPADFLEFRRDIAAAPLSVASLRHRRLMDSATINLPAVEDHLMFALADKFHEGIGAWFRT